MDRKISVDVDLMASIIGLPLAGVDPMPFFTRKEQDFGLVNRMKEKYDLTRDTRGFFYCPYQWHYHSVCSKGIIKQTTKKNVNECIIFCHIYN